VATLVVDGDPVEGTLVRPAPDGATVKVEAAVLP
jgi:hypothetical protein